MNSSFLKALERLKMSSGEPESVRISNARTVDVHDLRALIEDWHRLERVSRVFHVNGVKCCPFCGAQPLKRRTTLSEVYGYADQVTYECPKCGCYRCAMGDTSKGGYADNSTVEARALEQWNMRPGDRENV